jgi:hypothetical protein
MRESGTRRSVLPDPQPIAIRIIEPKLGQAVKRDVQVRDRQPVASHLPVILHDVLGIQIQNGLTGRVPMKIDRLIHHQATFVETEHSPTPTIVPALDAEAELSIELDASRHAPHGQHWNEPIHLHRALPITAAPSREPRNKPQKRDNDNCSGEHTRQFRTVS